MINSGGHAVATDRSLLSPLAARAMGLSEKRRWGDGLLRTRGHSMVLFLPPIIIFAIAVIVTTVAAVYTHQNQQAQLQQRFLSASKTKSNTIVTTLYVSLNGGSWPVVNTPRARSHLLSNGCRSRCARYVSCGRRRVRPLLRVGRRVGTVAAVRRSIQLAR